MRRTLLKSKIFRATVTAADVQGESSVTIDAQLMAAANILPYERVEIYNLTHGARLVAHALAGPAASGEIRIDGVAARHAASGDLVVLATYVELEEHEAHGWQPRVVLVDAANHLRGGAPAGPGRR